MKIMIETIDEVFNLKIEDDEPILVPTLYRAWEHVQNRFALLNADVLLEARAREETNAIDAIKMVRSETGWGLKEAKDFVESRIGREFYAKVY